MVVNIALLVKGGAKKFMLEYEHYEKTGFDRPHRTLTCSRGLRPRIARACLRGKVAML